MEIAAYLKIIRRWFWLLLVMTAVALGITYVLLRSQPTMYVAQTELLVGPGIDSPNSDPNILRASTQVLQTYAQLATTREVLQQVIDKLKLDLHPAGLASQITVVPNPETGVLTVSAQSDRQDQAVAIANGLADALIQLYSLKAGNTGQNNPGQLSTQITQLQDQAARGQARINQLQSDFKTSQEALTKSPIPEQEDVVKKLEAQLTAPPDPVLTKQIQNGQTRIQQLEATLSSTVNVDARRLILDQLSREDSQLTAARSQLNDQKRLIIDQLAQERDRLSNMQSAIMGQQNQILNQLSIERVQLADAQRSLAALYPLSQNGLSRQIAVIDPAVVAAPTPSKLPLVLAVAGVAGLVLALTLAYALDSLDDKIRTPEELAAATGARMWGAIGKPADLVRPVQGKRQITAASNGKVADAFRQMAIQLMPNKFPAPTSFLVASLEPGDGAAEIASNLAITLARAGKRVLLVDANIQHPTLGSWFQVENRKGLADWLSGASKDPGLVSVEWAPGLWVLPVGAVNENSPRELVWPRMQDFIERVEPNIDMLIVAGPPLSADADSLFLATHLAGVIAVAERGKIHRKQVAEIMENLDSLGVRVVGSIMADGGKSHFKVSPVRMPQVMRPDTRMLSSLRFPEAEYRRDVVVTTFAPVAPHRSGANDGEAEQA